MARTMCRKMVAHTKSHLALSMSIKVLVEEQHHQQKQNRSIPVLAEEQQHQQQSQQPLKLYVILPLGFFKTQILLPYFGVCMKVC